MSELAIITQWLNNTICRDAVATNYVETDGKVVIQYEEYGNSTTYTYAGSLKRLLNSKSILD